MAGGGLRHPLTAARLVANHSASNVFCSSFLFNLRLPGGWAAPTNS
jgi:hypothetical protein